MLRYVYTIRYEGTHAFSTARKAIECIKTNYGEWYICFNGDYETECLFNDVSTEKLIAILNKKGFMTLSASNESLDLEKTIIR